MRQPVVVLLALQLGGCGLSVEFRGEAHAPRRPEDVVTYEQAPTRAHRIAGRLVASSEQLWSVDLGDLLEELRSAAAKKGCDALRWNPNHVLVPGVDVSSDATGVFEQDHGRGRRIVTGGRAECLSWDVAP